MNKTKRKGFPSGLPVVYPFFHSPRRFSRITTSFEVWEKLFEVWGGLQQGASPCFLVDLEVWQWFDTFSLTLFAESQQYQWGSTSINLLSTQDIHF